MCVESVSYHLTPLVCVYVLHLLCYPRCNKPPFTHTLLPSTQHTHTDSAQMKKKKQVKLKIAESFCYATAASLNYFGSTKWIHLSSAWNNRWHEQKKKIERIKKWKKQQIKTKWTTVLYAFHPRNIHLQRRALRSVSLPLSTVRCCLLFYSLCVCCVCVCCVCMKWIVVSESGKQWCAVRDSSANWIHNQ